MEGLFCRRFLPQLEGKIDKYQFARKGQSTTDALISFLQPIYEAIDKGDNIAQIFFTDFSKGFDRMDHNILISNLQKLNIHPAITNWVSAFLPNRMQSVRIAGVLSDRETSEWRNPAGNKIGCNIVLCDDKRAPYRMETKNKICG
jgi:hypothetical protein